MGFGDGAKELMPNLVFDDAYEPNVFHAALGSDRVIFIENAQGPEIRGQAAGWWKNSLAEARSFVILPLCTNGQPAGFIYGDWDDTFPSIQLKPDRVLAAERLAGAGGQDGRTAPPDRSRHRVGHLLQRLLRRLAQLQHRLLHQAVLVGKTPVDRADRHAGALRHGRRGAGLQPTLHQQRDGRLDQLFAGFPAAFLLRRRRRGRFA
jgi:hypothetical protein